LGDPLSVNYQKYLQFVISLGMFIIAPLIAVYFLSDRMWTFLRADFWPGFTVSMLIALLMVLALPMNNYFTYLNNLLDVGIVSESLQNYFVEKEAQAEKVFEAFLRVSGTLPLIINIVLIALIPAVGEELLFRGVLQNILVRWTKNTFTGVIITSAVFALLHFQFLSVLPRFILGMVLGYIFVWTRSIWMPILAHLVNNAFAVIYYYMMFNGYVGGEMEHVGKPGYAPIYGFLSTLITGVLLYVVWKMMKTRVSQYRHERP
jgi:membrane protease YdiL (CAAX protease family)